MNDENFESVVKIKETNNTYELYCNFLTVGILVSSIIENKLNLKINKPIPVRFENKTYYKLVIYKDEINYEELLINLFLSDIIYEEI